MYCGIIALVVVDRLQLMLYLGGYSFYYLTTTNVV
uniref:Uncharacterized protein n=1 Tax=viral metagenome TaxID=1070528 RepID=A0A6C0BLL4_9ZZZZ